MLLYAASTGVDSRTIPIQPEHPPEQPPEAEQAADGSPSSKPGSGSEQRYGPPRE